jgi:hypothetical protein
LLQPLSALSEYAVEFRYPGHAANADDVKEAIKHVRAVRQEVRVGLGLNV